MFEPSWIDKLDEDTREYDREVKENARRYDREVWQGDDEQEDEEE